MPSEVYEVVAQGARYWFLLLMALIVWRSYRWYRRDRRQAKKRLKLLPDAGYVGEMVVVEGGEGLKRGAVFSVPWEGTLGTLRTNDLCVPAAGVRKRHCWFRYDDGEGLMVEPFRGLALSVDGEAFHSRREPLYMAHGSLLCVGEAQLRLRLFAGFESVSRVRRYGEQPKPDSPGGETGQEQAAAHQFAMQQWLMQQQWLMHQQMAYQQWMLEQAAQAARDDGEEEDVRPAVRDDSVFMRPGAEPAPQVFAGEADEPDPPPARTEFELNEPIYPPEDEDGAFEDPDALDEDLTDAAAPPRSAYVGHDEAERAKRAVWDKYFGGGHGK